MAGMSKLTAWIDLIFMVTPILTCASGSEPIFGLTDPGVNGLDSEEQNIRRDSARYARGIDTYRFGRLDQTIDTIFLNDH